MKNEPKKSKEIKITSGIHAGLWMTFGAGLGDLQIVPPNPGTPPPSPTLKTVPVA